MASVGSTLDSTLSGATNPTSNRFNSLTSEDFVKIMFTELQNQDPLKPNDSNTLLQQFSSLRSIEADLSLQQNLKDVVKQGQLSTAGGLLGKTIQGYTDNFEPVEGVVKSVSQTEDGPILNLADGARVQFKNVLTILDPDVGSPPGNTGGNGTGGTNGTGTNGSNGTGTTGSTQPPVIPSTTPPGGPTSGGTNGTNNNGAG